MEVSSSKFGILNQHFLTGRTLTKFFDSEKFTVRNCPITICPLATMPQPVNQIKILSN